MLGHLDFPAMSGPAQSRMSNLATLELPPAPGGDPGSLEPRRTQTAAFAINGRFYSQALTGTDAHVELLVPIDSREIPALGTIRPRICGRSIGHLWEQMALPGRTGQPILNLCNTAPLVRKDQVVCIHDANVFTEPSSYSVKFRLFYRSLLPLLARRVRVATVSDYSARMLSKALGIARGSVRVIPNGHEHVHRWNADASGLGERLAGIRPFVFLLGSRARHKNIELVLAQAEALDRLGLDLFVGGGTASIFVDVRPVDRRNIHWVGQVSDNDLALLYLSALCLAFPSRAEGFGLPIVEAMALGCPVVSSDAASMPEVCGAAALLAGPDDPAAWLRHFSALRQSRDLRDELRARGRLRVRQFSWKTSAAAYLDLLTSDPLPACTTPSAH